MTVMPILFSGPMVRAILDGRKSQTRRALKKQPKFPLRFSVLHDGNAIFRSHSGLRQDVKAPYAPGDLLWVRETWAINECGRGVSLAAETWPDGWPVKRLQYVATATAPSTRSKTGEPYWWNSRPSIHMPRWASRLTLEVTDVRVERVQDISEEDAKAEGVLLDDGYRIFDRHQVAFASLWDALNIKRGYGWAVNPWIVAITFKAHHCNVDAMEKAA